MSACRSCGAQILWATHSTTGSVMPLDEVESHTGVRFEISFLGGNATARQVPTDSALPGHPSHFSSCPDANKHRRSR